MPPKKSNASTIAPEEPAKAASAASKEDGISIEDLNLPKSIIQRLSKGVLPANTQIQKDALLAMSKSATVFVNYLTSHAAENAARNGKKTVMPKDIYEAMNELEFEAFIPRVEAEVSKFTSIQADKRNSYRKKVREEKKSVKDDDSKPRTAADGEESPPTKRARRSSLDNGEHATGSDEGDAGETVDEGDQEDEDVEDDEVEDEPVDEGLREDPLEERVAQPSDDEMADGDDSD